MCGCRGGNECMYMGGYVSDYVCSFTHRWVRTCVYGYIQSVDTHTVRMLDVCARGYIDKLKGMCRYVVIGVKYDQCNGCVRVH